MSTPRQGMAGTGGSEPSQQESSVSHVLDEANTVAESRGQETATAQADAPEGTVLITSRTTESAPYDIVLDPENVLRGGKVGSGYIVWYCPVDLVDRLRRHMLAVGGRIIVPDGAKAPPKNPPAADTQSSHPKPTVRGRGA